MATKVWVNIGSRNGLLPDGTKPSHEPMLTKSQWSHVAFNCGQLHRKCWRNQFEKYACIITTKSSRGQWVKTSVWRIINNHSTVTRVSWYLISTLLFMHIRCDRCRQIYIYSNQILAMEWCLLVLIERCDGMHNIIKDARWISVSKVKPYTSRREQN